MMLLLEAAPRSRRRSSDQPIREMKSTLGPDVGRSMRLGTELVIRHREVGLLRRPRQRGPDSIADFAVSNLCGEIKLHRQWAPNRRSALRSNSGPAPSFTTKHAPISSIDRAARAAVGPYVYVRQKLRRFTRSFELAAEHREGQP